MSRPRPDPDRPLENRRHGPAPKGTAAGSKGTRAGTPAAPETTRDRPGPDQEMDPMQEGPGADQDTKQGRRPSAPHQETKRSRERRGPPEEAEGTSRRAGPYREPGRDRAQAWRLDTDPERVERDLTRLVLTLVELVRQLVERQSVRRMEQGDLTDDQIETLGLTLMRLEEAMTELCERFDLSPADLNLDLGPLGTLLPTDPPDPAAPW
ncbi:hypothetical protein Sme01_30460 [Sphaerisporangium melleum]|uniref:Gas vesicle protein K n=2 Tax=Sphaerisporangium melleum TaxID=321316 RepID=A0A917RNZ7_9ACTN|nr:hypothetical protein GCM10007964_67730 [Sphaerisporangium melleum]GII70570.1 hypothetical protein Sme01_30460 [Sphaerisporangium melleum]